MELHLKDLLENIDIDNVERYVERCCAEPTYDNYEKYRKQLLEKMINVVDCIEKLSNGEDCANDLWQHIEKLVVAYKQAYYEMGMCSGIRIGYELNRK